MSNWYSQESDTTLGENEVHVWINYLNVHQARLKHLYPALTAEEKERSERFKFYKHRKLFIASHGFLHTALSNYIDTPVGEILFDYNTHGKPSIICEQNPDEISFNLSHSGHLAILAVCRKYSIGVDIEFKERKTDWQGIIKRFFTEKEQQALYKLPENLHKDAFYQMWTRKEAHMKVTGMGLSLAPTQFEISTPPEPAAFLGNLNSTDSQQYKMQEIILPSMYADYSACLSANFEFEKITQYIQQ